MPIQNHRHVISWLTILGLLARFPPPITAQQHESPPDMMGSPSSPGPDYSPPMATVLVVMIAIFFTVGFVSVYLRHYAMCLGIGDLSGGGRVGGGNGAAGWRRQAARGLDPAVVEAFPTFLYSDVKVHRIGKGTLECAVCINEFSDHEILRLLPGCSHVFHPDCIGPWLASHVTCPVCRADLESQQHGQIDTLVQQLQLSEDESEPSNQITQQPRNNHDDHHVVIGIAPSPDVVMIKSPVQEIKDGGCRRGTITLPRSHSTGHSLVEDCERFTLRLPDEVRNKLVNTPNMGHLPGLISPRIGYRARSVGCTGMPIKPDRWRFSVSPPFISRPGPGWSPKSDGPADYENGNQTGFMSGPRRLFKLSKSPLNRVTRTSDIGERSSDKLWPNRPSQELDLENQIR